MRFFSNFLTLSFLLSCCACSPYSTEDFIGNWEAISITEAGDSLAVNVADIQFSFRENGTYSFQSTLDFTESGTFRIDGPYLYTTDTSGRFQVEKAVEITRLENDTLEILMQERGKERRLMVVKE